MATDETRRPRPDPTAPDAGNGRTNGERPNGADSGRPVPGSNPWALNESRSGSASSAVPGANGSFDTPVLDSPSPDYGGSAGATALPPTAPNPIPLDPATAKMAALPGPPLNRLPGPVGGWPPPGPPPGIPRQAGPPRAWVPPGPAHTWGPAGPVSAWPPPPPGPSPTAPKGPSNKALAWLLAGVVTLAGGLLLWATRASDSYVPPPTPASEFSSASSQLPAAPPPPVAAPSVAPTTSTPPPTVRRVAPIAPVRTPIRTTPTTRVTTKPSATKTSKETSSSTKTSKSKSSRSENGFNNDTNNDTNNFDDSNN